MASAKSSKSNSHRGTSESHTTTDHEKIRKWVESRGGHPACVKGTGGKGDAGVIRIDYPGYSGQDKLEEMDWDSWFEKFDEKKLAFVYQETTSDGDPSRFSKLVDRDSV